MYRDIRLKSTGTIDNPRNIILVIYDFTIEEIENVNGVEPALIGEAELHKIESHRHIVPVPSLFGMG